MKCDTCYYMDVDDEVEIIVDNRGGGDGGGGKGKGKGKGGKAGGKR